MLRIVLVMAAAVLYGCNSTESEKPSTIQAGRYGSSYDEGIVLFLGKDSTFMLNTKFGCEAKSASGYWFWREPDLIFTNASEISANICTFKGDTTEIAPYTYSVSAIRENGFSTKDKFNIETRWTIIP